MIGNIAGYLTCISTERRDAMAKGTKTPGPKEAAMREQRETAEATLFDVDAYQKELDALRDKHLSGVKARITELQAKRREIDEELNKLNSTESKILGRAATPDRVSSERFRASPEQLLEQGALLYQGMTKAGKHNELAKGSLAEMIDPKFASRLPKIIDAWNAANKDKAIRSNGKQKNQARYLIG